tara:strand:+ start:715 stop:1917 length:1203 start_codon:yes stop_codon:yes gene_type:complete
MTNNNSENIEMNFIDLCSGIGGFHQALTRIGARCVFACDIDEECRKNYEENYNIKPETDLCKLDIENIPNFDILCAGFPCQPFSKAGHQNGFDDDRGNIFFEICKIIKHHNPKYLILENVRNFTSHDKGNTWKIIKQKIDELNYYTYENPVILNTLYFGIPQSRERVVILCKRKDLGELSTLPVIDKKLIKDTSLSSIIDSESDNSKYNITGKLKITEQVWNKFLVILNTNKIAIPKFPIWTEWWDNDIKDDPDFYNKYKNWIDKNRDFYNTNKNLLSKWLIESRNQELWKGAVRKMEWQTGQDNLTMKDVLWSPRGSGVRIKKTNYSPTLVAMASMIPIYGPLSRELTPRECARLQSFPDSYIIHENDKIAYKQFGNAVNVTMIERAARFLILGEELFK